LQAWDTGNEKFGKSGTRKVLNIFRLLLLTTVASFAIAACENDDGMAEKAGQALDDAGDTIGDVAADVGNAIEDACEDVKKSADAKDTDC
jgi:hypothetical protein